MQFLKLGVTLIISFWFGICFASVPEKEKTHHLGDIPLKLILDTEIKSSHKEDFMFFSDFNSSYEEKLRLAKAITSLYKKVSFREAFKVVDLTYKEAEINSVKPTLALGLIAHESGFNKVARSSRGAIGYTQVLPRWHQDKIKGRNIQDPYVNIQVGMQVLGLCFKKSNNDSRKALACYNGATKKKQINTYINAVYSQKQKILQKAYIQT